MKPETNPERINGNSTLLLWQRNGLQIQMKPQRNKRKKNINKSERGKDNEQEEMTLESDDMCKESHK